MNESVKPSTPEEMAKIKELLQNKDGIRALEEAINNGGWGTCNGITVHALIKPKVKPPKPDPIDREEMRKTISNLEEWLKGLKVAVSNENGSEIWFHFACLKEPIEKLEERFRPFHEYEHYMLNFADDEEEE